MLTIFGGFLFGWLVGGAAVALGATAGATTLFLAARSAFGDFLRKRVGGVAARFADGFEKNAFSYLLVLRLAPVFPFFVVNIVPALFNVKLRTYVGATFLGILPGTFAYAYLGQGVDSVLLAARRAGHEASVSDLVTPEITIAFAALAFVAAIPVIINAIRGSKPSLKDSDQFLSCDRLMHSTPLASPKTCHPHHQRLMVVNPAKKANM